MSDFVDMSSDKKPTVNKKLIILSAIGVVFAVSLIGGLYAILNAPEENSADTVETNDPAYEAAKASYAEMGIEYTYEDWQKDQNADKDMAAQAETVESDEDADSWAGVNSNAYLKYTSEGVKSGVSESKKKYIEETESQINDLIDDDEEGPNDSDNGNNDTEGGDDGSSDSEETDDEKPTVNIADIMNAIVTWTHNKNAFIGGRFGWAAEAAEDEFYEEIAQNTLAVLNSMASGDLSGVDTDVFSYEEMVAAVKSSIYYEEKYTVTSYDESVVERIDGWCKAGHPNINAVNDLSLTVVSDEMYLDDSPINIIAAFKDGDGNFWNAYIGLYVDDENAPFLEIEDIRLAS